MSNWDCCGALHQQDELSYPQYEFHVFINCRWWQQMLQLNNENVKLYPTFIQSLNICITVRFIFRGGNVKHGRISSRYKTWRPFSFYELWCFHLSAHEDLRCLLSGPRLFFSTFKYFYLFLFSVLIDNKTNRWCVDPLWRWGADEMENLHSTAAGGGEAEIRSEVSSLKPDKGH